MTVMLFPRGIILAVNGPLFFLRKPNIENVSASEDLVSHHEFYHFSHVG